MAEGQNLKISAHAVAASELSYHNNASLLQHPHLLSKQKSRFFQTIKLEARMSSELSIEAACSPSGFWVRVQPTLPHGMRLGIFHLPCRLH